MTRPLRVSCPTIGLSFPLPDDLAERLRADPSDPDALMAFTSEFVANINQNAQVFDLILDNLQPAPKVTVRQVLKDSCLMYIEPTSIPNVYKCTVKRYVSLSSRFINSICYTFSPLIVEEEHDG